MKQTLEIVLALALAACAIPRPGLSPEIKGELDKAAAAESRPASKPGAIEQNLLPPLRMEMPSVGGRPVDPKFDLAVNNAPAAQVFMAIVSGTRYSMLIHPSVTGTISVNLKDVSVQEALDAVRELYGYEYKIDGTRIYIEPISIQTKIFNVNYLIGQRLGRSDVRVTSGSIQDAPPTGTSGVATPLTATGTPTTPGAQVTAPPVPSWGGVVVPIPAITDGSRVMTQTRNDFWDELERTLRAIVGNEPGRSVTINAQAGVVVVRAMPGELRNVDNYLKAIRNSVQRQVVLEAKIIEVTLNNQFQTGINWAAFPTSGISAGPVSPGTVLQRDNPGGTGGASLQALGTTVPTGTLGSRTLTNPSMQAYAGQTLENFTIPGTSLFGLALQSRNLAALLTFLETQGAVQVLSSPRIATINNQKAVLKVGTDQFFLTNISGSQTTTTTTTTGTAVPSFPTITLRPFFSGVALDITPQIDEDSNIILHIHPSVSDVQTDNRQIDLGAAFGGQISLPVAKSNVSETDSIVKLQDGAVVAIGGLMKMDLENTRSGLPGAQDIPVIGGLFGSTNKTMVKKELVVLIKPTVVQSGTEILEDTRQARERVLNMIPAAAEMKK